MRSLVVAMNERLELEANGKSASKVSADSDDAPYTVHRVEFTKEHKKNHTILAPQMAPIQFEFVESVFHKHGYKLKLLKQATREDIECGLKYVNNDACFPTLIVVGQMINAILKGDIDPDNTRHYTDGWRMPCYKLCCFLKKGIKGSRISSDSRYHYFCPEI